MLDRILIGSSAEPSDPNFKNVTLLLHGDGSNGAQNNTFLDSSTNNFTITRNGNTTQGSFSPYGSNWSNYFDGSGDYISAPSNAALNCGTGDWTFECWVFVSTRTTNYPLIFGNNLGGFTTDALAITASNSDSGGIYQDKFVVAWGSSGWSSPSTGNAALLVANATNSNNTWYHLALVRNGTSVKMYRNGVEVASATVSSGATFNWGYTNALLGGGNWDGAGGNFNGYISNARLLKGTALYTSAFTPSTAPLTAITNTSLLTCQSNRFRDASTNNFTITRNGDVKVTNFAPFAPSSSYSTTTNGGSAYFDGTGDYLQTPSNTAFTFSGSLTIEFWINFSSTPSNYVALVGGTTANTQLFITTKIDGTGLRFGLSGVAEYATGSQTWAAGAWYHVALVRNGTDVRFYVNGVNVTDGTATNSTSYSGAFLLGGNVGGTVNFPGYISNLRIVKDTAVYTAAFTPPTAPVTAITNTSLLLNATNAAIFDNSMKNDLETVGNAQISTSVKKFGTGSMAFDGSGDWLQLQDNEFLELGSSNLTIEMWVNTTNSTQYATLYSRTISSFTIGDWSLMMNHASSTGGDLAFYAYDYNGSSPLLLTTGVSIRDGAWHHIALVRNGSSWAIYVDGTSRATATWSGTIVNTAGGPTIGRDQSFDRYYTGYIDDLRVTNGVARYTANFTAPTAPFPNK